MEPRLKCLPCTDDLITGPAAPPDVDPGQLLPDAITLAPLMQTFAVSGQQIAAPLVVPVCFTCRQKQLGTISKAGLVTA